MVDETTFPLLFNEHTIKKYKTNSNLSASIPGLTFIEGINWDFISQSIIG